MWGISMNISRDREYHPDVWIIVEFEHPDVPGKYHKILAGWYGGFANGDSWKLSSAIEKISELENEYVVDNMSGSKYHLDKFDERLSSMTGMILSSLRLSEKASETKMLDIISLYKK